VIIDSLDYWFLAISHNNIGKGNAINNHCSLNMFRLKKTTGDNMYRIESDLRLRWPVLEEYFHGQKWYEDEEIQYLVNGTKKPYSLSEVVRMFDWLNKNGEFFFIEVLKDEDWIPIGDATLLYGQNNDVPITIGDKNYHSKGIGKKVLNFLIEKAKDQGFDQLIVEIYDYNEVSKKLYQSFGFKLFEKTEDGHKYRLRL